MGKEFFGTGQNLVSEEESKSKSTYPLITMKTDKRLPFKVVSSVLPQPRILHPHLFLDVVNVRLRTGHHVQRPILGTLQKKIVRNIMFLSRSEQQSLP